MDYRTNVVTAPTKEPVDLPEMKNHLRVDINDDDSLILALTQAAREWCEDFRRQSFITQTWDLYVDSFPASFELPRGPVQSVTGVYYTPDDEIETEVDSSSYVTDLVSEPARIVLDTGESWPSDTLTPVNGVRVRYVAGYGDDTAVPETIRSAIKLLVGHLYENREDVVIAQGITISQVPFGVKALLWPGRALQF